MLSEFLKSIRTRPVTWGLAAALALFLCVAAVFFKGSPPGGNRGAAQARASGSSSRPEAAAGRAAEMDFAAWSERISKATPAEFAKLMREIMNIRDPELRDKVATALVGRWVAEDLPGFIAFVDAAEVDDEDGQAALWSVLAPALAKALTTLPDDVASRPELAEIVRRLIGFIAQQDPDQALKWTREWLMGDIKESALATIAGELVKRSPEQALAVLAEIQTSVRRVDAIDAIAEVYGVTHPKEATQWARTLESRAERPYAMNAVLVARAGIEPEASSADFNAFRDEMSAAYAIERQAEIARMGLKDVKPHEDGTPLTPEEAMDFEVLPSPVDPQMQLLNDAAKAIAEKWAETDPGRAMAWSESLQTNAKDEVIGSALSGWAAEDPQAAYDYYMKNHATLPDPAEPIFESWAGKEPELAARRAGELKDPALRENAVSGVVAGWLDSGSDRTALQTWVDQLPAGRARDLAGSQIADSLSFDEPAAAWREATAVQDRSIRRDALKSAFASLVESDPNQARTLLAQATNLSPDETKRLNKMLNAATQKSN